MPARPCYGAAGWNPVRVAKEPWYGHVQLSSRRDQLLGVGVDSEEEIAHVLVHLDQFAKSRLELTDAIGICVGRGIAASQQRPFELIQRTHFGFVLGT
jgi:hypothetical protein